MPLNRFYLTQSGWMPECPIGPEPSLWSELAAEDVLSSAWPVLDDEATSPPPAPVAQAEA